MEIHSKLATKPKVKGTITIVSCISIAYVATQTKNWYRTCCAFLIGMIGIVIGIYQTPPLCTPTRSS
jgi:hypothetical protein